MRETDGGKKRGTRREKSKWEIIKIGSEGWRGRRGEEEERGEREKKEQMGDERDDRQKGE